MKIIAKAFLLCVVFCVGIYTVKAQNLQPSSKIIQIADSLFKYKSYKRSAKTYFSAFVQDNSTQTNVNLLNAAKACANAHQADSSFVFLSIIVNRRSRALYDIIAYEPALSKLWHDQRWSQLLSKIESAKKRFNSPVALELDSLQKDRDLMDLKMVNIIREFGKNSDHYYSFRDSVLKLDINNATKLKSIIHTYGWPTAEDVDDNGVRSLVFLFLKLNFQDQKRYYPLISTAFKSGGIDAENYAVITDKISLLERGGQIYGTQPNKPVINKDSLNHRRMMIGLHAQ